MLGPPVGSPQVVFRDSEKAGTLALKSELQAGDIAGDPPGSAHQVGLAVSQLLLKVVGAPSCLL